MPIARYNVLLRIASSSPILTGDASKKTIAQVGYTGRDT